MRFTAFVQPQAVTAPVRAGPVDRCGPLGGSAGSCIRLTWRYSTDCIGGSTCTPGTQAAQPAETGWPPSGGVFARSRRPAPTIHHRRRGPQFEVGEVRRDPEPHTGATHILTICRTGVRRQLSGSATRSARRTRAQLLPSVTWIVKGVSGLPWRLRRCSTRSTSFVPATCR